MQAPTRTFHGYYIIPCFSEKCCTTLQSADEVDQQPKKSFTIESILSRPSCSTAPTRNEEFSTSSFPVTNKHLLSSRLALPPLARIRTHPYRPALDLKQARSAATYRAIVADSQPQIPRRHLGYKDEKPKRIRTVFTPEQLDRLEKEFDQQQYMVGTERFYLASELGLTETQVKVWFQNRRIKWRRQNIEAADGASDMTGESPVFSSDRTN